MSTDPGSFAAYIAFGEALGYMESPPGSGIYQLLDVHGAGAQRSDPKSGNPADWPYGNGPQGDVVRIDNHVRCVRDIDDTSSCGDINDDDNVNLLDITFLIDYLYSGGQAPDPMDKADVDGNGSVNLLDVTYLINFLYKSGPEPACI